MKWRGQVAPAERRDPEQYDDRCLVEKILKKSLSRRDFKLNAGLHWRLPQEAFRRAHVMPLQRQPRTSRWSPAARPPQGGGRNARRHGGSKRNSKVVIKPNRALRARGGTNTHPEVVRELGHVQQAGASRLRVLDHPLRL